MYGGGDAMANVKQSSSWRNKASIGSAGFHPALHWASLASLLAGVVAPYWVQRLLMMVFRHSLGLYARAPMVPALPRYCFGTAIFRAVLMARRTLPSKSKTRLLASYLVALSRCCLDVPPVSRWGPGSAQLPQAVPPVLRAYRASCLMRPEYPQLADCWEGIVVNLSTRLIKRARMLVEFGRGAKDGSRPIAALASSKETTGWDIL